MAGERRKAREAALQALYEIDLAGHPSKSVLDKIFEDIQVSADTAAFARELVQGVVENRDTIDTNIKQFASAWPLDQMSVVDRNILRMGIFELLWGVEVPPKAAINEALEIAKKFSTEESTRFINGLLDRVRRELGP